MSAAADARQAPMRQTLDQMRARYAWQCAQRAAQARLGKDYVNLAKGAPALVMGSGLMPTLAFYNTKPAGSAHARLLADLVGGLLQRMGGQPLRADAAPPRDPGAPSPFAQLMQQLQGCDARAYLRCTDEALELLRWIRHFADAVDAGREAG